MRIATQGAIRFRGEEGKELIVRSTNRGEPYREGAELELLMNEYETITSVFLETREAIELRDLLLKMYPLAK